MAHWFYLHVGGPGPQLPACPGNHTLLSPPSSFCFPIILTCSSCVLPSGWGCLIAHTLPRLLLLRILHLLLWPLSLRAVNLDVQLPTHLPHRVLTLTSFSLCLYHFSEYGALVFLTAPFRTGVTQHINHLGGYFSLSHLWSSHLTSNQVTSANSTF